MKHKNIEMTHAELSFFKIKTQAVCWGRTFNRFRRLIIVSQMSQQNWPIRLSLGQTKKKIVNGWPLTVWTLTVNNFTLKMCWRALPSNIFQVWVLLYMQYKNLTFLWCWAWCFLIETNIWEGISGVYLELWSNEMQEKVLKYDAVLLFFSRSNHVSFFRVDKKYVKIT